VGFVELVQFGENVEGHLQAPGIDTRPIFRLPVESHAGV
jgi:hypothetical protein